MTTLKNNNPNEYNDLAKINTHSYGGDWQDKAQLATFAKNNGNKRIWQTETGPLSWNPPPSVPNGWWIRHYDMAYRLVEDMRNLNQLYGVIGSLYLLMMLGEWYSKLIGIQICHTNNLY